MAQVNRRSQARALSAGFTLVEVLVAIGILSIGLVPILVSLRGSVNLVSGSEKRHRASLFLQDLLHSSALEVPEIGKHEGRSSDGLYHWQVEADVWRMPSALPPWAGSTAPMQAEEEPVVFSLAFLRVSVTVDWLEHGLRQQVRATELVALQEIPREGQVLDSGKDPFSPPTQNLACAAASFERQRFRLRSRICE